MYRHVHLLCHEDWVHKIVFVVFCIVMGEYFGTVLYKTEQRVQSVVVIPVGSIQRSTAVPAVAITVGSIQRSTAVPAVAIPVGSTQRSTAVPAVAIPVGSIQRSTAVPAVAIPVGSTQRSNAILAVPIFRLHFAGRLQQTALL